MDLDEARAQFATESGWLNTASYGLPPTTAWDELQAALQQWRTGRTSWEPWGASVDRARHTFAQLVGAEAGDVTTGAQVSQLLAPVAAAVPDGGTVVAPLEEFTSNLFPWLAQEHRGVRVCTAPADRLAGAVDESTDVVAFSLVQSSTGAVADVDAVVSAARAVGAITVVDATQACGWLPLDARRFDALVCGAYKWLLSPRGTAFLVTTPHLRDGLRPDQAGWWAADDPHDAYYGPPLRLADDARKLDISPAWFSWVGTAPALELLGEVGVEAIRAHDVGLANRFRRGLDLPTADSAIVAVDLDDADAVRERLAAAGITAAVRDGRLRASFHLYTTADDVDRALTAVAGQ